MARKNPQRSQQATPAVFSRLRPRWATRLNALTDVGRWTERNEREAADWQHRAHFIQAKVEL
ncbi:hypothetical protein NSPZN2_40212 [Nitrospira defluvii]|uniref:Uncharacterized protein n=1 Tax=Nitrospira defluvii TaxID=330214 RepID=A0ABN7LZW5_9BACT|nr:hypothetical protein NSPZN2_40212 [Nitrospira defluvii]